MGRKTNDGRGRIGGRAKGTKNKPKKTVRQWAAAMLDRRREQFEKDLDTLTPQARAAVLGPMYAAAVAGRPVDAQAADSWEPLEYEPLAEPADSSIVQ